MEGWNDPPKNVGEPTGNLKINLNKRVAFPLGPSAVPPIASHEAFPPLLPPKGPPKGNSNSKPENLIPGQSNASSWKLETSDDSEQFLKASGILKVAANELDQLNGNGDIIAEKLRAFDKDWKDLDQDTKALIIEMVDYLQKKDYKNTAAVHRKIVLKGFNKPWMLVIRQLYSGLEKNAEMKDESKNQDSDSTSGIMNIPESS